MAKRDIKLNIAKIEEIARSLNKYKSALESIERTINSIGSNISKGEGKAINKLKKSLKSLMKDLSKQKEAVDDLYQIFSGYLREMQKYIKPNHKDALMQVDRNDIWRNKQQIIDATRDYAVCVWGIACDDLPGSLFIDDDEKKRRERNFNKLVNARNEARDITIFEAEYEELDDIYKNKVIPFENMDDTYGRNAKALHNKYTGFWESLWGGIKGFGKGVGNFVRGVIKSVCDFVSGIASLAVGILKYAGCGIVWIATAPFNAVPDWAQGYLDNTHKNAKKIFNDPMLIIEGLGQGISDAYEEEGMAYCTGYVVGEVAIAIALDKGLSKVKGLGKADDAADTGKVVDKLEDVSDAGKGTGAARSVDDITKGAKDTTRSIGKATNLEKSGGYQQALDDFQSMQPSNTKSITTKYGDGMYGTLPDGTTLSVRPGSGTGGATLEIKVPGKAIIKIRY